MHIVNDREISDICVQHLVAMTIVDGTATFASVHDHARIDDPAVRTALEAMLMSLGHDVVATGTSDEAFAAREEAARGNQPFEVACIDLTMPGDLDGATVIARLREHDPVLDIVVMSGYSVDPVMARHRELRLLGALQKPFTLDQLEAVLNRH